MERLTYREMPEQYEHNPVMGYKDWPTFPASGVSEREILDRLAAYEDTGLMPEEINKLLHDSTGPLHKKPGQWIDAARDGRLVILPCKMGTEIFAIWNGKVYTGFVIAYHVHEWDEGNSVGVMFDTKSLNGVRNFSPSNSFGKTLFFTREEAEAALKGVENAD